jgi:hypothetical protein
MNIGYYNAGAMSSGGPGSYAGYGLAFPSLSSIPSFSSITGYSGRLIDSLPLLVLGAFGGAVAAGILSRGKGKRRMAAATSAGGLVGLAVAYLIKIRQDRAAVAEAIAAQAAAEAAQAAASAAAARATEASAAAGW